jgi:hypothetical protein
MKTRNSNFDWYCGRWIGIELLDPTVSLMCFIAILKVEKRAKRVALTLPRHKFERQSMVKLMKLRGQVRLNMDRTHTFLSSLYDGTPFQVDSINIHDYELNDEFQPDRYTVEGWLYVVQEAQQNTQVYLTLPKPSLPHGRQILVHEFQLMPRSASINDFKPQKMGGKVKVAKIENGKVVENTAEAIDVALKKGLSKKKSRSRSKRV